MCHRANTRSTRAYAAWKNPNVVAGDGLHPARGEPSLSGSPALTGLPGSCALICQSSSASSLGGCWSIIQWPLPSSTSRRPICHLLAGPCICCSSPSSRATFSTSFHSHFNDLCVTFDESPSPSVLEGGQETDSRSMQRLSSVQQHRVISGDFV